jgi:hypothetical protein
MEEYNRTTHVEHQKRIPIFDRMPTYGFPLSTCKGSRDIVSKNIPFDFAINTAVPKNINPGTKI